MEESYNFNPLDLDESMNSPFFDNLRQSYNRRFPENQENSDKHILYKRECIVYTDVGV